MTSARGQHVSVLHFHGSVEPWDPPITTFTDSGGSLRSAPRSSCFKIDRDAFADGKNTRRCFVGNPSSGSFARTRGREFASGKGFSVTMTSVDGSSSALNAAANRELSPVRWCDREVDGVYLGKSGWVQVHQRFLTNGNRVVESKKGGVSTLSSLMHFSDFYSGDIVDDDKLENNRPSYLPLPMKKRENRERSCHLFQDVDSVSPPSLTPIISPPPAFKDRGLEAEFHIQDGKRTFSGKSLLLSRSKAIQQSVNPSDPRERWDEVGSPAPLFATTPKHRGHPPRMPQTKSLDDTFNLQRRDRCSGTDTPLSLLGSRSLDSEVREVDPIRFKKRFDDHEDERNRRAGNEDEDKDEEGGKDFCERHPSRPRSYPREVPNGQKTLSRSFRHRNLQRNGRRISGGDFAFTSKYKEKSLDSSSSGSSSCSSPDRKSPATSFWKYHSKQSQPSLENHACDDGKHFNVKRSRSLQLSEKRSPNDLSTMTHSSSGKSWDQMPSEYSAFPDRGQNSSNPKLQPLQGSQQLVLTSDESPLNLSFTRAEEKLMTEADKEVRIITEFLNGTRSREAARKLLLYRYLNRPEDEDPVSESEYGIRFVNADRKSQAMVSETLSGRTQPPERQFFSLTRDFRHRAGPVQRFSFSRREPALAGDSGRLVNAKPTQTSWDKKKAKKGGKKSAGSLIESSHETDRKNGRRCVDHSRPLTSKENLRVVTLHQLDKSKTFYEQNGEKHKSKMAESETEGRQGRTQSFDDTSSASSWSSDFWRDRSPAKNVPKGSRTCSPSKFERVHTSPGSEWRYRPGSAPANDDFATRGLDQRSFSLPRSFLSDLYGFRAVHHGSVFPRKPQHADTRHDSREWVTTKGSATTAPATPVDDSRDDRKKEIVNGISSARSSSISVASEPLPPLKPQFIGHKLEPDAGESLAANDPSSDSDKFSGRSSRSVLQKFKKNLSSKFSRTKGGPKINDGHVKIENGENNEKENLSTDIFGLQNVKEDENVSEELLRGSPNWKAAKEKKLWRKAVRCAKYGSHDSGIQIGNRGNIDSSESQDTDLQEEMDSPLLATLDRLNASKESSRGKGVRRTNSDLGCQRLYNWDVKNQHRRTGCSSRGRSPATVWPQTGEGILRNFITERQTRPQLRRSISQPLGLNELPSFLRSSAAKCTTLSEDEQNLQGGRAEDEFGSDSECSISSLSERKKTSEFSSSEDTVILAEAVWDHVSMEPSELPFRAGDVIEVLDTRDRDWWWGARGQNCGYFPSVFVRLRVSQEDTVEDCLAAMAKGNKNSGQLRRGKSISLLSNDQVRSGVVRELLNTERDFVKVLRNVREGFLFECRRRADMFTPGQIAAIFSNLEDLLVFQENFLKDLEERLDRESPHKSCVGEIFLNHSSGFRMYSEYCNSHPMAIATLQELYQNERYVKFFETCRLKRSLIEIPLDGYLLTPVQRICKYPLQLAELLKYTKPEHPDWEMVREALEAMRSVATLINERKRKMESLEKLAAWQQRVEGWEGEDLIETSSQLIHQGDVVRITSGMWTSTITLFLFDRQILYCKKDLIKRNTYTYKGRIFLDTSEVIDIPDGKDQQLGVTVRHGLKIYSCSKDKWVLFCCRTAEEKTKWLEAFAEEKKVVTQDREGGLNLPPAARQLARMAARTKKGPPVKPTGKNNKAGPGVGELSTGSVRSGTPKATIGRKMGTWFTFGGGKSPKMSPGFRSLSQRDT